MGYPSTTYQGFYRNSRDMVINFLREKHGIGNVKIYNLCSESDRYYRRSDFPDFKIQRYPMPDHNITSIKRMFNFCMDAALFLQERVQAY